MKRSIWYPFNFGIPCFWYWTFFRNYASTDLQYDKAQTCNTPSWVKLEIIALPPDFSIALATLRGESVSATIHPPPPAPVSFAPYAPALRAAYTRRIIPSCTLQAHQAIRDWYSSVYPALHNFLHYHDLAVSANEPMVLIMGSMRSGYSSLSWQPVLQVLRFFWGSSFISIPITTPHSRCRSFFGRNFNYPAKSWNKCISGLAAPALPFLSHVPFCNTGFIMHEAAFDINRLKCRNSYRGRWAKAWAYRDLWGYFYWNIRRTSFCIADET